MRRAAFVLPASMILAAAFARSAFAASFPDVSSAHPFRTAILELADMGIIQGYDNGNFGPNDPVNRAQMLTLLYRLAQKTPATAAQQCFADVNPNVWYSDVVCDAAAMGYVQGYSDKTFKPEKTVNRAEALKMVFTVLGFPMDEGEMIYPDVPASEWYAQYVSAALAAGILPIPGQTDRYQAGVVMLRGETAQLLYQVLHPVGAMMEETEEDVMLPDDMISDASSSSSSVKSRSSRSSSNVEGYTAAAGTTEVMLPFDEQRKFGKRETMVYTFPISEETIQLFSVRSTADRAPQCRLYRIENDGLTFEYYIGAETGQECWMRVALSPGKYQLEIIADTGDMRASTETVKGDGSDGFVQAKIMSRAVNYTTDLAEDDHADWYKFEATRQEQHTISAKNLDSTSTLGCAIYPLKNVSLFGFDWPECNKPFTYEKGTYVIGVMHSESALKLGQRRSETAVIRLE